MEEKRKHPRRKAGYPALFRGGDQALEKIRIHDISMGGLFVENPKPVKLGETVIINIDAYDIGKDISIRGCVVRTVGDFGMGIKIHATTNDDFLREWLSR